MSRLRVHGFAISIDGFGAGPDQDLQNPLGVGGPELFEWFFPTRTWQRMHGNEGGETGVDDDFAARGMEGFGAWILGRNMFGPVRGPWPDDSWKGWWGDEPPYHVPVFVLTHHARAPVTMKGGTEFRFVTGGIHAALEQAREAAGGRDVRVGGGVSTIRQYLTRRTARRAPPRHRAGPPRTRRAPARRSRHARPGVRVRRAHARLTRRDAPHFEETGSVLNS